MGDLDLAPYALITDAPPLKQGGHGCHVLAWNWVHALQTDVKLIVTHQLNPKLSLSGIAGDLSVPTCFYPDLCRIGTSRVGRIVMPFLELPLFLPSLRRISAHVRASGAKRLFALCGANVPFLFVALAIAGRTKLPLDLYLVDDFEASARLAGRKLAARWCAWFEPRALRRADRVFAISPGYVEHLASKYGCKATWLPVPISERSFEHIPFQPETPDVRDITFIGAVNPLYFGALRDVLAAIQEWNSGPKSFKLRLLLMSYTPGNYIERHLGRAVELDVLYRPLPGEFHRRLGNSWAILLAYSFDDAVRTMVNTSFPTKLVDSLPVGRPIIAYGPATASVPRYFMEQNLPLCATSRAELGAVLTQIGNHDSPALVARYRRLIHDMHSPVALKRILNGREGTTLVGQGR